MLSSVFGVTPKGVCVTMHCQKPNPGLLHANNMIQIVERPLNLPSFTFDGSADILPHMNAVWKLSDSFETKLVKGFKDSW